jgi:lipopolysaccharide export system protein LptA
MNLNTRRLQRAAAFLLMLSICSAQPAFAQGSSVQGVPNAVQGFSQNRDKPIQIDAQSLELRDKDKAATFSGDVKVVQGDTTMLCKTLVVFYDQNQPKDGAAKDASKPAMKTASPGPGGSSSVKRLEARGGVKVMQKDQVVTGETGIFDVKTNQVTVMGNVVLTQGENVLAGDRLIVDMTTGVSRVESNTRVKGLFKASGQSNAAPGVPGTPAVQAPQATGKPMNLNDLTNSPKR